jgi:hypothetical protein
MNAKDNLVSASILHTHSTCNIPDVEGEPSAPNRQRLVHQIQARHLQAVLLLPISDILNLQPR